MIRPLHPIDFARYALYGGVSAYNRAHTLDNLGSETRSRSALVEVARQSLWTRGKSIKPLLLTRDENLVGIVAARPRSGPRAWEVSHLLVATDDDSGIADLLVSQTQVAARKGGDRVFLRLRQSDPLANTVMRLGFVPCAREILFAGRCRPSPGSASMTLRIKTRADDYKLFQLYNASAPADYRYAAGVTFDQWMSAREKGRGSGREYVYESAGQVRGWGRTIKRSGVAQLQMMIHPDDETNASALMDYGLMGMLKVARVYCLVPEFQILFQRLLAQRGYEAVSEYVTFVRFMAAPVRDERTRKAATVASA